MADWRDNLVESDAEMAAVLAADAPDLPGMLVGKLLQPLTSRVAAGAAGRCCR